MNDPKIFICLYSNFNFLAINILENLLSKNCFVCIVTKDCRKWRESTYHLSGNNRFNVIDENDNKKFPIFNYSIFCGGFISKSSAYKEYRNFLKKVDTLNLKSLVVFSLDSFVLDENINLKSSDNLAYVYLGDLFGPRIDINSDLFAAKLIVDVFKRGEINLAMGEAIYPMFVADVAKVISKWLFSFGPYGKEVLLLGTETSGNSFLQTNQKMFRNKINIRYDSKIRARIIPKKIETKIITSNLDFALLETYKWIFRNKVNNNNISQNKPKKNIRKYKGIKWLTFLLLVFFLLPFLLIISSGGLLYWSSKNLFNSKESIALNKLIIADRLLEVANVQSNVLLHIPLIGRPYIESAYISNSGQKICKIVKTAIPLIKTTGLLFDNILGDNVYDSKKITKEISTDLELIHDQVLSLESDSIAKMELNVISAKMIVQKVNFNKIKIALSQGSILANNLPNILGDSERKTYLFLFQNNMELRPTGGFIGSFGLMTFDGGRMSELAVSDVYSADGQLKGHVEPPAPIKNYLNEANWWLRDSNWDPDFPTSAKRAEWFLDKEIDQKVDGVFAVDLSFVKEILKITGPIFIADYNLDITSDNLYEKIQSEVESDFFPGSHRKASFLTALSRNLISKIEKESAKNKLVILSIIYKSFEERHLQAYLHDDSSQEAISNMGWSGEVRLPFCGEGCYADLVGLTEANLGVNKSNYFITRRVILDIDIHENLIYRKLILELNNSANIALGSSGTYNVYIRSFVPDSALNIKVKDITGVSEELLKTEITNSRGYKEVGVMQKILGGQSKKIEFSWESRFENGMNIISYGLYIRKQGGIDGDPWQVRIFSPQTFLTSKGVRTYNTILTRDFTSRIDF